MSTLPLLPPPPPRFPQTFTDQDDDKLQPQANGFARQEGEEGRVGTEWRNVKTQGEEHVQRLGEQRDCLICIAQLTFPLFPHRGQTQGIIEATRSRIACSTSFRR